VPEIVDYFEQPAPNNGMHPTRISADVIAGLAVITLNARRVMPGVRRLLSGSYFQNKMVASARL
jgi:hypothetical protein